MTILLRQWTNEYLHRPICFADRTQCQRQVSPCSTTGLGRAVASDTILHSSNYVTLQTTTLFEDRFGIEAVRLFDGDTLPILEVARVDKVIHKQPGNNLSGFGQPFPEWLPTPGHNLHAPSERWAGGAGERQH